MIGNLVIGLHKPLVSPLWMAQTAMRFEVDTTLTNASSTAADQFQLPLLTNGYYNFHIDWGDGTSDLISAYNDAAVTHTYSAGGTYDIVITGDLRGWGFPDPGRTSEDHSKITDLKQFGCMLPTDGNECFHDCINMVVTATDVPDLSLTSDCANWFDNCDSIVTVPSLLSWDFTANGVTSLNAMFARCAQFNQAIGGLKSSGVTNFRDTFAACAAFNNGGTDDIRNLDISSATTIHAIVGFSGSFNQPVDGWDTSNVTAMSYTFAFCSGFNQDLSSWDTSKVTDMNNMFWNAAAFKQDLSAWDVTSLLDATSFGRGTFDINDPDSATNQDNYDAILNSWAAQAVQSDVPLGMADSKYSAAGSASRAVLTGTYGWTISDGGSAP